MNFKAKNKKLLIIVGSLLLFGGVSFAFFISRVLQNGIGGSTSVTTATIKGATINIEGTLEFNDLDILPGHQNVSSIKVTATGNNELIPYNLIWNGTNTLNTPLNYKVYKTSEQVSISAICEDKTKVVSGVQQLSEECTLSNMEQLGTEIADGTISKSETESKTILVKDEFVTASTTGTIWYYYVVLEYPNLGEPQNLDMGGVFRGKVTVEESNTKPDINILAAYIKQEDGTYTESTDIPKEGYVLNNKKSTCSNGATPGWDASNHRFYIDNLIKSGTSCYLYFDKYNPYSARDTILAGITVKESTPNYASFATTDEGVYKISDGMYGGDSYVWRGAVNNNWVEFANTYWRIIRINGDGTMRLIYTGDSSLSNVTVDADGITATGKGTQIQTSAYSASYDRNEYVGYTYTLGSQRTTVGTSSTIKIVVDDWYNNNIGNNTTYISKVADGKYCNDRNTASGYSWASQPSSTFYYATNERLHTNKAPTLSCTNSGDIYTLKAGLITADEVSMAGGLYGTGNSYYYLYTNQEYWTMSPFFWYYSNDHGRSPYMLTLDSSGNFYSGSVNSTNPSVRPVINLKADTVFAAGGTGTFDNPYIVE